jgi:hypothetical protein
MPPSDDIKLTASQVDVVAFSAFRAASGIRVGELRPGRPEVDDYVGLLRSYTTRRRNAR